MAATNEQWQQGAALRDAGTELARALILAGTRLKRQCDALRIPATFGDEAALATAQEAAKPALYELGQLLDATGPVLQQAGAVAQQGGAVIPVLLDGWTPPVEEPEPEPET
jgi:hypothetical protein